MKKRKWMKEAKIKKWSIKVREAIRIEWKKEGRIDGREKERKKEQKGKEKNERKKSKRNDKKKEKQCLNLVSEIVANLHTTVLALLSITFEPSFGLHCFSKRNIHILHISFLFTFSFWGFSASTFRCIGLRSSLKMKGFGVEESLNDSFRSSFSWIWKKKTVWASKNLVFGKFLKWSTKNIELN